MLNLPNLNISVLIGFMILLLSCGNQPANSSDGDLMAIQKSDTSEAKTEFQLDKSVWVVFQDNKGNFWFGSNGKGLYHYDGKELINYTTEEGLPSNRIGAIQEDKSGNIFITTLEGISKFDGQSFSTLPVIESNQWKFQSDDLWFNILGQANNNGPYLIQMQG